MEPESTSKRQRGSRRTYNREDMTAEEDKQD
jgi:hypothetical protein